MAEGKTPMNLCIFSNFFPPKTGGSSHYAYDLAVEMEKRRNKVTVITARLSEEDPEWELNMGVHIHRLPSIKYPSLGIAHGFDLRWTLFPTNFLRILDILISDQIDVIHVCGQFMDLVIPSVIFSKLLGIKSVLSIHTRVEHTNYFYDTLLWFADFFGVGFLVRSFDEVIALDNPCEEYIRKRYGVIPVRIKAGIRIPKAKQKKREKIILSVSHITSLKDPTSLVKAIPYVIKDHPDARFVFIGKQCNFKPMMTAVELGLEKNTEFIGEQPFEKVSGWYDKSMIECHDLNLGLGMGSSTLEAMGAGLCVLTAAKKDNFWGDSPKHMHEIVYVKKNDPEDIAKNLNKLLSRPKLVKEIGENARRYVTALFEWDLIGDKMEELYKGLAKK